MGSSYIERLLWKYIKDNVFGGYKVLIDPKVAPYIVFVVGMLSVEFYLGVKSIATLIILLLIGIVGVALRRRDLDARHTILIIVLGTLAWGATLYLGIPYVFVETRRLLMITLIVWFVFNLSMFIIQMGDLFASTGGLALLYGSDEERVFLSPLVIIVGLGFIVYATYRFVSYNDFGVLLPAVAMVLALLFTYGVYKGKGRIVKSAHGFYVFMVAYTSLGLILGFGYAGGVAFWFPVTLVSILFAVQSHARRLGQTKSEINFFALTLVSFVGLVVHLALAPDLSLIISIYDWWFLSIIAAILTPFTVAIYLKLSGRLSYYVERNRFSLGTILKEATVALGVTFAKEIKNVLLKNVFSKFL